MPFLPGDRISAGHLTIEFADPGMATHNTVVFVDNTEEFSNSATTVVASLDGVLGPQAGVDDLNKTHVLQGSPQMRALIRAGRELASYMVAPTVQHEYDPYADMHAREAA